jgi:hypothetical protein
MTMHPVTIIRLMPTSLREAAGEEVAGHVAQRDEHEVEAKLAWFQAQDFAVATNGPPPRNEKNAPDAKVAVRVHSPRTAASG